MTSQRNPGRGFMSQRKEMKPTDETEYLTIENVEKVISVRQWKKGTIVIAGDSILTGIEQKRTSGNRSIKVGNFPATTTHDMYDYLKPLLKKESRQPYLAYWNQ